MIALRGSRCPQAARAQGEVLRKVAQQFDLMERCVIHPIDRHGLPPDFITITVGTVKHTFTPQIFDPSQRGQFIVQPGSEQDDARLQS